MRFIELFCGVGGFRYGLEACNREQQKDAEISGCGSSISDKIKQPNESEKWGNYTCVYSNDFDISEKLGGNMKPSDDIKLKTALNQCLDILEDLKTSREDSLEEIAKTFERLGYRREA